MCSMSTKGNRTGGPRQGTYGNHWYNMFAYGRMLDAADTFSTYLGEDVNPSNTASAYATADAATGITLLSSNTGC